MYKMQGTLLLIAFFFFGCGGGGSTPTKTTIDENSSINPYSGNEISIIGENLTTPEATLKKIEEIPEFSRVKLPWIVGEWASYSVPELGIQDRTISLRNDGTYAYQDITLIKKTKSKHSGHYTVYAHVSSKWYVLLLTPTQNSVVSSYILEKEDDNSFRLVNKGKYPAFSSNFLYTRLNSKTPAIYPGMYFLGTYQYTDDTDIINGSSKNVYHYQFNADNTLIKKHYFSENYSDFELRSEQQGVWKINQDTFQLELMIDGVNEKYTIGTEFDAKGPSISLTKDGSADSVHWKKVEDIAVVSQEDQFVGEYRNHTGTSNITIKKSTNGYLVDIKYTFLNVDNLEAKINSDGDLEMSPPNKYQDKTLLVFKAGYNRLIVKKDEASSISQMEYIEKISREVSPKTNTTIYGGWNTRTFSTDKYVDLQYYMHDGTYYETDIGGDIVYGTYTLDAGKLTTSRTCNGSSVRDISFNEALFENILTYYPIAGIKSFGEAGSQLESILFKHQLDVYQTKNGAKLKPHPKLKNAYLFTEFRQFNDTYNWFKLQPDGTGTFYAGSSLYYEEDFTGLWNQHTNSHLYNIKYMVIFEDGKEYMIYYNEGINVNYSGYNSQTTVLNYTETIEDAKKVELFHGRTALCYKIGDQSRSKGIVLPLDINESK